MSRLDTPVVVGAGPVGLAAALFLAQQGRAPRVIEMRAEPAKESKALAINPRTLEILESTRVTGQMLELGLRVRGARFYRGERQVGELSFAGIHPRYPFMLALSQAASERLLARALEAAGGHVERGIRLADWRPVEGGAEAVFETVVGKTRESVRCNWLLGADGAYSTVRERRGIPFEGSRMPHEWHLADAPLRTALAEDYAHIFFLRRGAFLFLLRVVDETMGRRPEGAVWRVLGNRSDPLSQLSLAEPAGQPIWTSEFHVSHRLSAALAAPGMYLAGDAAHVHSPIGARGMNLGIEDAFVFAQLALSDRLAEYDQARRPVDERVVRRVELLTKVAAAEKCRWRFVRALALPRLAKTPFIRRRIMAAATGLDHELPDVTASNNVGVLE